MCSTKDPKRRRWTVPTVKGGSSVRRAVDATDTHLSSRNTAVLQRCVLRCKDLWTGTGSTGVYCAGGRGGEGGAGGGGGESEGCGGSRRRLRQDRVQRCQRLPVRHPGDPRQGAA